MQGEVGYPKKPSENNESELRTGTIQEEKTRPKYQLLVGYYRIKIFVRSQFSTAPYEAPPRQLPANASQCQLTSPLMARTLKMLVLAGRAHAKPACG